MAAETDMMFVCDVLPSTRPRCFLRVSAWAILLAVAAVTCLSPIVLNSRILGLIVVAVWVWFELRGSGANPPLRFYREWYARRGHTSPADAVLGLQPAWLYYIVVAVIVLCPILPLTVVLVSAGLATVLWRLRRCFLRPFRGVVWEYIACGQGAEAHSRAQAEEHDFDGSPGGVDTDIQNHRDRR